MYTSVFVDIVDNFNQDATDWVTDDVTGYTLAGIEHDFLKHVYGFGSLSDELKSHKPSGVTDVQIDNLMNSF